jgi:histidine ammonia-lyase
VPNILSYIQIGDIVRAANGEVQVEISQEVIERITRARAFVYQQIGKDEPVYGFNRGVDLNKDRPVQEERFEAYNRSLIYSHSIR